MNEIVQHQPNTLAEKMNWSTTMAGASLLPRQYRDNPGNLLFAVEYADALGINRMAAITSIHVIDGKPSASADLIANLVRKAGHKLRVSGDEVHAVAQIIRADDPDFTYEARWDLNKARQAGLLGKGVWKSYPGAMLRARAITEVARMGASEALFGVIYTPEELDQDVDPHGAPVQASQVAPPPRTGTDRLRQVIGSAPQAPAAPPAASDATDEQPPAPPVADTANGITPAQLKKMGAAMREANLTGRTEALAFVARVIGREVTSRNDLTKREAGAVIDALETGLSTVDDEVVEGEVVDETSMPSPVEEGDPDAIWAEILDAGSSFGWDANETANRFRQEMNIIPDEASAAELATFLGRITTGEAGAA